MTRQRRYYNRAVAAGECIRSCGEDAPEGKRCPRCRSADSDYMREWMRWKRGSALPSMAPYWAHGIAAAVRAGVRRVLQAGK